MGSSHHGDNDLPFDPELAIKLMEERRRDIEQNIQRLTPEVTLGKQHDFPDGHYGPGDEGAIAFAVGHDAKNHKVIIDFRTPVHWMALDADQALHLAKLLTDHARAAGAGHQDLSRAICDALVAVRSTNKESTS